MTLRLKLILVSILLIIITLASAGFFGYRQSKWHIKNLARELLIAKTEHAYALCDLHYKNELEPNEELKEKIAELRIAEDGYMAVIDNTDGNRKGVLIVHPTATGRTLYTDRFPHIKKLLDEIDAKGGIDGYSGFINYTQGTKAKGRQGEQKVGYFKYFKPWKWVILATEYEKDVYANRDQLRTTLSQLVLGLMLVGIFVVYIIIRQMFLPVQRLTESTKEVARGNWDISLTYNSNDEIGTLSKSFNQMVRSLRENARMWHEFRVAQEMQAQMLPQKFPEIQGVKISAKSIPTKEVGGDFYDFLPLNGNKVGIVVGDVSGHGVSAAMVMTAAMGSVRFAAEEKYRTEDVLNMVNKRLNKDIQNNMFVALFYAIYEPETNTLYYTNAGQTMPYLLRNGEIAFLPQAKKSDRFPLGIVKTTLYEQMQINLQSGDKLVFYTDGIVDAMNGNYESFGFDRFANSIIKHASAELDKIIDFLIEDMKDYSGDANVHDDVTIVIVEIQ